MESLARTLRKAGPWVALACLGVPGHIGSAAVGASVASGPVGSGATLEMAALLKERAAAVNPARLPFSVNDRRAELLGQRLQGPLPLGQRLQTRFQYASELLAADRIDDCLGALDTLQRDAETNAPGVWASQTYSVQFRRALAYLRIAEEQNCCASNTRDSCLLPIQGQGIHQKREGSKRAIELLQGIVDEKPDELMARWLLNVAHMTLGSYPDGVPERHLIPPAVFASQYPLPRFDNVAKEVGVDVYGHAGGAILDDFDNDGRLDLVVSSTGLQDQMRFLHNTGDGTFEDRTSRAGLEGEVGGLNLIQADYDNDGFVDVLVLRGGWMQGEGRFPLSLLRNDGKGGFEDVTRGAGLLRFAPTQTATWLDYDGDGWLDLYVGNESSLAGPEAWGARPCELFHNNGDGTFTEVAKEAGVDYVGWVKGVVSGDYDNDGRPDLYVSVLGGDNLLFRNDGGGHFTDVAGAAGVTAPRQSFSTFFFDYDNDGWLDLFVVGYSSGLPGDVVADYLGLPARADRGRLYHNKQDGTFEDVTQAAGLYHVILGMGLNFGDLDNDGFLDFYVGTGTPELSTLFPNRMFRNAEGRFFQDVTTAGDFGHLQKGHAICFGDIDNDGDQDVFEVMGGAFLADKAWSALYENPGGAGRWLDLELEGVRSNRGAIGARIKVAVETGKGTRLIYRSVGSGGSFGASPLRQEIGLGAARRIVSVEITWPGSGHTQAVTGLELDSRYRIREGVAAAARLERPSFVLGGEARARAQNRALALAAE